MGELVGVRGLKTSYIGNCALQVFADFLYPLAEHRAIPDCPDVIHRMMKSVNTNSSKLVRKNWSTFYFTSGCRCSREIQRDYPLLGRSGAPIGLL